MIALFAGWFAKPLVKYGVIAGVILILIACAVGWYSSKINQARRDGGAQVIDQVQKKTIETLDNARTTKEKADEAVRSKPVDAVIDGLR